MDIVFGCFVRASGWQGSVCRSQEARPARREAVGGGSLGPARWVSCPPPQAQILQTLESSQACP